MPVKSYQDDLLVRLQNTDYAASYLKATFDETLANGDTEAFVLALRNVVDATGMIKDRAPEQQVTQQHLHSLLAQEQPTLEMVVAVLSAVGLSIDFKPIVEGFH